MKIIKHSPKAKLKSLLKIKFYKNNRCFTKNEEEAKEYGFDKKDVKRFSNRVKKLKKDIIENGWNIISIIYIGIVNGEIYIVDGQGRVTALKELVEEGLIDPYNFFLQTQTIEYESYEEMEKHILSLNTNKVNWSSKDIFRSKIKSQNDEDSLKALEMVTDIVNEFEVSDGIARTILFGYDGVRCNKDTVFKASKTNPLSPLFLDFIRTLKSSLQKAKWGSAEIKRAMSYSSIEAYTQIVTRCMAEDGIEMYNAIKDRICSTLPYIDKESAKRIFMGQKRDYIRTSIIDVMSAKLHSTNKLKQALRKYQLK